jgi:hypothetical protein
LSSPCLYFSESRDTTQLTFFLSVFTFFHPYLFSCINFAFHSLYLLHHFSFIFSFFSFLLSFYPYFLSAYICLFVHCVFTFTCSIACPSLLLFCFPFIFFILFLFPSYLILFCSVSLHRFSSVSFPSSRNTLKTRVSCRDVLSEH